MEKKKKINVEKKYKILLEGETPKILRLSSVDIQKLLIGSLRDTTTPAPPY